MVVSQKRLSYGWKGSAKSHNDALKARMEERGLTLIDNQK